MCNLYSVTTNQEAIRAAHGRAAGHQHPQHVITALANVAQAGKPVLGPGKQLRRVRAGAKPGDQEKGCGVVRAQRGPAALRVRWHLDRIPGRPGHEIQTDPGASFRVRLPDDRPERRGGADPSQSDAGHPGDR